MAVEVSKGPGRPQEPSGRRLVGKHGSLSIDSLTGIDIAIEQHDDALVRMAFQPRPGRKSGIGLQLDC